jgi:hypothetical protein
MVSPGTEDSELVGIQVSLDSLGHRQTQETQGEFIARTSESPDPLI